MEAVRTGAEHPAGAERFELSEPAVHTKSAREEAERVVTCVVKGIDAHGGNNPDALITEGEAIALASADKFRLCVHTFIDRSLLLLIVDFIAGGRSHIFYPGTPWIRPPQVLQNDDRHNHFDNFAFIIFSGLHEIL